MIKKLRKVEGISTDVLSFQSQGMNISLGMTLLPGEKKFLSVKVDGVSTAVLIMDGTTATWSTGAGDSAHNDAGVYTISLGVAPSATAKSTTESRK